MTDQLKFYLSEALEALQVTGEDAFGRETVANAVELDRRARNIAKCVDQIFPGRSLGAQLVSDIENGKWWKVRTTIDQAIYELEEGVIVDALLEPSGPALRADALHPSVWDAARPYWHNEHRRAAVDAATRIVTDNLQTKARRNDISGTKLIEEVFNTSPPAPGHQRLVLRHGDESESAKSLRQGALAFSRGCYLAFRNPAAHDTDELDPQVALEQLAAFSILARWIDEAEVVEAPDPA